MAVSLVLLQRLRVNEGEESSEDEEEEEKKKTDSLKYKKNKLFLFLKNVTKSDLDYCDLNKIVDEFEKGMKDEMSVEDVLEYLAQICGSLMVESHQYAILGGRLITKKIYRNTPGCLLTYAKNARSFLRENVYDLIKKNAEKIEQYIDHSRDFSFDLFAIKTLEKSYLLRNENGQIIERPQYLFLRVALALYDDISAALNVYKDMSKNKYYTHATPTLFNAGLKYQFLSSCYMMPMFDDSLDGIMKTLHVCAQISKHNGGIGLHVQNIRGKGSYVNGINGKANGIVKMLKIFDSAIQFVDQGGKRPGAITAYLEPWHIEVFEFLNLRKTIGSEEMRARNLLYALWIPDLFMKRVRNQGRWTLMCPSVCPDLDKVWGKDFETKYEQYEKEVINGSRKGRIINARDLWTAIISSQINTGTPFMLYKDNANRTSNHRNFGTITGSNLCTEIIQYSAPHEVAVCNLASMILPSFLSKERKTFNFQLFAKIIKRVVYNLNQVIDKTEDISKINMENNFETNNKYRPIGIGVQGLADVFQILKLPFESKKALKLNAKIFEVLYFSALHASMQLAKKKKMSHFRFESTPVHISEQLHCDYWPADYQISEMKWKNLRQNIKKYGLYNSLFVAIMPTASTAQIFGSSESTEPYTSNLYTRNVLSGNYFVINKHLEKCMRSYNLWTETWRRQLIKDKGSVKNIPLPYDEKRLFKTAWEIDMIDYIQMSVGRAPFIDQSQSLSLYISKPNMEVLTKAHFATWMAGLKTGMYYLRMQPATNAIQFTIEPNICKTCTS